MELILFLICIICICSNFLFVVFRITLLLVFVLCIVLVFRIIYFSLFGEKIHQKYLKY